MTRDTNQEREKRMKERYGITIAIYEEMFVDQGGVCKICEVPPRRMLVVDHCHLSGKVRGLLCSSCNLGLGKFRDNVFSLANAK